MLKSIHRRKMAGSLFVVAILQASTLLAVSTANATDAKVAKYSEYDVDIDIIVPQDTVIELTMPSNMSTGYDWVATPSNSNIRVLSMRYVNGDAPEGFVGVPGTKIYYIAGASRGAASLSFIYKRPFEEEIIRKAIFSFYSEGSLIAEFEVPQEEEIANPVVELGELNSALPPKLNWCGTYPQNKICSAVANQGNCGSCWAFAAIAPLEILHNGQDGVGSNLSEQFLVNCATDHSGCNGGRVPLDWLTNRIESGGNAAGAPSESTLPYAAQDQACNGPYAKEVKGENCSGDLKPGGVSQIKQLIYDHGPIWAGINADSVLNGYEGGIIKGNIISGMNHAIAIIGWDETDPKSTGYWYIKNSWGNWWGEGGYGRIEYGNCNIASVVGWIDYGDYRPNTDSDSDSDTDSDTDSDSDIDSDSDSYSDSDSDTDSDSDSDTDDDNNDDQSYMKSGCGCSHIGSEELNIFATILQLSL